MKVLLHLLEGGSEKSYMVDFGKSVTQEDMAKLLKRDEREAVASLLGYSRCLKTAKKFKIPAESRIEAESAADFVLSQRAGAELCPPR